MIRVRNAEGQSLRPRREHQSPRNADREARAVETLEVLMRELRRGSPDRVRAATSRLHDLGYTLAAVPGTAGVRLVPDDRGGRP
jgi:hypothetical protein